MPSLCMCSKLWRATRSMLAAVAGLLVAIHMGTPAIAAGGAKEFAATLIPAERKLFEDWLSAQASFDFKLDAYWREVSDKRAIRKRKRSSMASFTANDYVIAYPPVYSGPQLTPDLARRWTAFQVKREEHKPPPAPKPGLEDFLRHAQTQFEFVPERVSEREFKLRYAREAIAFGLTKDQVVRIYALETSGLGTADMVAGIHPITKKGSPISTAIGYAQLLAANSVSELAVSGPDFIERLRHLSASAVIDFERAARLNAKIIALKKMTAVARSVPNVWSSHMAYARTAKGMGIHAINLDGEIGPWLQVIKLKGLKETAARNGRTRLTGAEIELMNLAGPMTGIEMMMPVGRTVPTPNFFERDAYYRNTIVRGKTSAELLAALDERMNENLKNAGAIEFAEVFDQVAAEQQAAR